MTDGISDYLHAQCNGFCEQEEKEEKQKDCSHKYWNWVWKDGIWTDERVCTTCGFVEKCVK